MRSTVDQYFLAGLEEKITIGNNTLERWVSQYPHAVRELLQEIDYLKEMAERGGLAGAPGIDNQLRKYATLRSSAVRKLDLVNL